MGGGWRRDVTRNLRTGSLRVASLALKDRLQEAPGMHTHDMENHDNLYADEVAMRRGESPADASSHALWAVALIAAMVMGLGIGLTVL